VALLKSDPSGGKTIVGDEDVIAVVMDGPIRCLDQEVELAVVDVGNALEEQLVFRRRGRAERGKAIEQ